MKNVTPKRKYLLDIVLVLVVIALAIFVFYRMDQILDIFRTANDNVKTAESVELNEEEVKTPPSDQAQPPSNAAMALAFTLNDLDGDKVSLTDFSGTPVMVNFWATWCPPCRAEMPIIQDFAEEHRGALIVLAVNAGEELPVVEDFVKNNNFGDLIFLLDPEDTVSELYRVPGFPTSLFIDPEGLLQGVHIGELDDSLLMQYLAEIGVD